jgi:hypothetical protein
MSSRPHTTKAFKEARERWEKCDMEAARDLWYEKVARVLERATYDDLHKQDPEQLVAAWKLVYKWSGEAELVKAVREARSALHDAAEALGAERDEWQERFDDPAARWRRPFRTMIKRKDESEGRGASAWADTRAEVYVLGRLERLHPQALSWWHLRHEEHPDGKSYDALPENVGDTRFRKVLTELVERGYVQQEIREHPDRPREAFFSLVMDERAVALRQRHSALRRAEVLVGEADDLWDRLASRYGNRTWEDLAGWADRLDVGLDEIAEELVIVCALDKTAREIIPKPIGPEDGLDAPVVPIR